MQALSPKNTNRPAPARAAPAAKKPARPAASQAPAPAVADDDDAALQVCLRRGPCSLLMRPAMQPAKSACTYCLQVLLAHTACQCGLPPAKPPSPSG